MNFTNVPGALKKYVDQLIVKKLLQIPGFKESTNLLKSCQASSDEYGTCLGRLACLKSGGRAGSVCGLGTFCCTGKSISKEGIL